MSFFSSLTERVSDDSLLEATEETDSDCNNCSDSVSTAATSLQKNCIWTVSVRPSSTTCGSQRSSFSKRQLISCLLQRWLESLFQTPTLLLFQNYWIRVQQFFKFENLTLVHHRSNRILAMFLLKKWPPRLLLLPKLKSDTGSGPGFHKLWVRFRKKTKNPAGVDSGSMATSRLLSQQCCHSIIKKNPRIYL